VLTEPETEINGISPPEATIWKLLAPDPVKVTLVLVMLPCVVTCCKVGVYEAVAT
jgi:hypothetical protein